MRLLNHRINQRPSAFISGFQKVINSGADTYDYYYNMKWQAVVEFKNGAANRMNLFSAEYIDALAVSVTASARHFYTHDANVYRFATHTGLRRVNRFETTLAFEPVVNVTSAITPSASTAERYSYSPYGKVTYRNANFTKKTTQTSSTGNNYLFTGRRLDPETGLCYFRNRYYSCEMGRFVNRDPIRYNGSKWNLYAAYFVPGGVDPTGKVNIECTCDVASFNPWASEVVTVNCLGLATTCCPAACEANGLDNWTGDWEVQTALRIGDRNMVCGADVRLYTGEWCVAGNVWKAAQAAFNKSVEDSVIDGVYVGIGTKVPINLDIFGDKVAVAGSVGYNIEDGFFCSIFVGFDLTSGVEGVDGSILLGGAYTWSEFGSGGLTGGGLINVPGGHAGLDTNGDVYVGLDKDLGFCGIFGGVILDPSEW